MPRRDHYWLTDDSGPYAILLRLIETYCHPEAWEGAYDQLKALAQRTDDLEMRVFKRQLTAVITKPECLPKWVLNAGRGLRRRKGRSVPDTAMAGPVSRRTATDPVKAIFSDHGTIFGLGGYLDVLKGTTDLPRRRR